MLLNQNKGLKSSFRMLSGTDATLALLKGSKFSGNGLFGDPLPQLLPHLEKRELFRLDIDRVAGFGVSASIGSIFLYHEAAEAPDFDPLSLLHGLGHRIEDRSYDFFGFLVGNTFLCRK